MSLRSKLLAVSLLGAAYLLLSGSSAHAQVPGAPSNFFPDTNTSGRITSTIVQISPVTGDPASSVWLKSRTTMVAIYVPVGQVGQNIPLRLIGACDGGQVIGRDNNGWYASTNFYVRNFGNALISGVVNSDTNCSGGDVYLTFNAVASARVVFGTHYEYTLVADAVGAEGVTRYLNAFQVETTHPNVVLGISLYPIYCDYGSYPHSCPTPVFGSSAVYTSLYGATNPYSQYLSFTLPGYCGNKDARITLYDLDLQDGSLAQNLNLAIWQTPSGGGRGLIASANNGTLNAASEGPGGVFGANNNQSLVFPSIGAPVGYRAPFTIVPGTLYELEITGINSNNALQISVDFDPNCNAPATPSCSAINVVRWADDSPTIRPGDRIKATLSVTNANGYRVGVNGDGYPPEHAGGDIVNYLTPGGVYARASAPITAPNQSVTIDTIAIGTNPPTDVDNAPLSTPIFAPGSAQNGVQFNWGLVLPGTGWHQVTCTGTFNVVNPPPPVTTIYGRVVDADDPSIGIGGVSIELCAGSTTTDGSGNFSYTFNVGTGFCVRATGGFPGGVNGPRVRPTAGVGYNGCAPFAGNRVPNYCGDATYEGQAAGASSGGLDRSTDDGYEIALVFNTATISGRVMDYENIAVGYSGVQIDTCTPLGNVTTGVNGAYSFTVRQGRNFCLRPVAATYPSGASELYVRPWAEGYAGCPGYGAAIASPNYCNGVTQYNGQAGGQNNGNPDRNSDSGYDFAAFFPYVDVRGRVFDYDNIGAGVAGVVLANCIGANTVTTDANGAYQFTVRGGTDYCVRPQSGFPANSNFINVRPYAPAGYNGCGPFTNDMSNPSPNYCAGVDRYECQRANASSRPGCGTDRASDNGFDFSLRYHAYPVCSLTVSSAANPGTPLQPGDSVSYVVTINNQNSVPSGARTGFADSNVNIIRINAPYMPANTQVAYGVIARGGSATVTYGPFSIPTNVAGMTQTASCTVNVASYPPSSPPPSPSTPLTPPPGTPPVVTQNFTISVLPYVKTYGNDVKVGGGFGASCVINTSAAVKAYLIRRPNNDPNPAYRNQLAGAGASLAVVALDTIEGYQPSAINPGYSDDLAFANNPSDVNLTGSGTYRFGGNFGAAFCNPDYYATLDTNSATALGAGSNAYANSDGQYFVNTASALTLASAGPVYINPGVQSVIYSDKDILIRNNIAHNIVFGPAFPNNQRPWNNVNEIPYLAIVVRGANIYIHGDANQVDVTLIAQPDSAGNGGNVYTCASSATPLNPAVQADANFIEGSCTKQISFISPMLAKKVFFYRGAKLDYATRTTGAGEAKSVIEAVPNEGIFAVGSAEKIKFNPEFYLTQTPFHKLPTQLGASALTSLPPGF